MGMRRANEHRMRQIFEPQIVDVAAAAGQEAQVFATPWRIADDGLGHAANVAYPRRHENRFRCRCDRRRLWRHVHAVPAAQARLHRPRDRGRPGRRRHLVLEPLSRRALRRRERAVLLSVLEGTRAGMGMDRALRHATRDPEVCQPRRRPLRPAARHPVRDPRHKGDLRRKEQRLGGRDRQERQVGCALRRHRDGLPLVAQHAEHSGARRLQGPDLPHRQLAA